MLCKCVSVAHWYDTVFSDLALRAQDWCGAVLWAEENELILYALFVT